MIVVAQFELLKKDVFKPVKLVEMDKIFKQILGYGTPCEISLP